MTNLKLLDPNLFSPNAVDAKTAGFNNKLEAVLSTIPPSYTMTPEEIRADRDSGKGVWGPVMKLKEARDRDIEGEYGKVSVRIVVPDQVNGVYMHMHGGGFVMMRPYHFDQILVNTAKNCNVAVVSVDYRLAPEDPYPAAAEDCESVALWLAEYSKAEFGTENLIIGGESAGANLAVVALNRVRDKHGFQGFLGANLVYGCFDISMTPSQRNWGDRNLIISTPMIEYFNDHYVPQVEKRQDPDVSPLYADLKGLPPALFSAGTVDPLLDDSLFMYSRWVAAGNRAELALYPGGTHVFNLFPIDIAKEANENMYEFIRDVSQEGTKDK